jgi:hypothetical protein
MGRLRPGGHGSTFGGNPVSCASAVAAIQLCVRGISRTTRSGSVSVQSGGWKAGGTSRESAPACSFGVPSQEKCDRPDTESVASENDPGEAQS